MTGGLDEMLPAIRAITGAPPGQAGRPHLHTAVGQLEAAARHAGGDAALLVGLDRAPKGNA